MLVYTCVYVTYVRMYIRICLYVCMYCACGESCYLVVYSLLCPPLFTYGAKSVCVHECVDRACLSVCVCPTSPATVRV